METRRRGRPRAFNEEQALDSATEVFLAKGLHDAKLDDLAARMGINKPSLYGAFGDKSALYRRVVEVYTAQIKARISAASGRDAGFRGTIELLLDGAVEQFLPHGKNRTGCLVVSTLSTAAGDDTDLRGLLATFLQEVDDLVSDLFSERFSAQLAARNQTPGQLAGFVNDLVYALALRARAGESRSELKDHARLMLDLVFSADRP